MSAHYRTIGGMLGLVEANESTQVEVELLPEPTETDGELTRKTRKRDSLRKLSVRHLVNKLETRATESFERNFSGRFSRRRIAKENGSDDGKPSTGDDPEGGGPAKPVPKTPCEGDHGRRNRSGRSWYMVHLSPGGDGTSSRSVNKSAAAGIASDKITADRAEFSESALAEEDPQDSEDPPDMKGTHAASVDREDSGRWSICSDFERVSLPDVNDVCDTWNEFIYLRLSNENAQHLNSYNADFETAPFDDEFQQPAEASNTIISLRFTAEELQRIIHGYCDDPGGSEAEQPPEPDGDEDEVFSQASSDGAVFEGGPVDELGHNKSPTAWDSLDEGISFKESPVASPEPHHSDIDIKISFLIDELLETERNYINTLEKGIATYVDGVFTGSGPTPPELCGKKYHLFGNLEYIYRFHRNAFLPKLLTTGNDVERIADVFVQFLENDSFYGYILYSMYHPKSQRLCEQHIGFFEKHQQAHGDKLGVKSLILQPIQRLPRYQLLLTSLFKQLIKKPGAIARNTQLHKVCVAEKRLQTLIGIMNESVTINDILQCEKAEDDEVELGFGVPKPAIVLKNQNHDNQVLFLYPKDNDNVDRNKPINVLHLGKFRSVYPVFINDPKVKRQFQAQLFVFERCVIYAEQIDVKCLTYRGHYTHQEIEFDFGNRQILKLFSRRHDRLEIEVKINIQNPGKTHLVDIMTMIQTIIDRRDQRESLGIDSGEVFSGASFANRSASYRSSICSTISDVSFQSAYSHPLPSSGPDPDPELTPSTRAQSLTSEDQSSIEKMLHFQQHFERALNDGTTQYIRSLPDDVSGRLEEMVDILDEMLRFQRAVNYQLFEDEYHRLSCDSDVQYFCGVFRDCFRRGEFEVFLRYVEHIKTVEAILMSFEQYYAGQPKLPGTVDLSIDAFLYLPVKYVNRCGQFFNTLRSQKHDEQSGSGSWTADLSYVHEQMGMVQRRVNENYQIRQLIMDVEFLNEIGLVSHSEIVKLEGSYAVFRLMLTKTGALCMKINAEMHNIETYSSVTFYCPYTKLSMRASKRHGTHLYVYLDSRKTTLIFPSRGSRYLTIDHFTTLSTRMKQKEREKKRSFFYVPSV